MQLVSHCKQAQFSRVKSLVSRIRGFKRPMWTGYFTSILDCVRTSQKFDDKKFGC